MAWTAKETSGEVTLEELLYGLAGGRMTNRRENTIEHVFNNLDELGTGFIATSDMLSWYDASCHPDVRDGKTLESEAHTQFVDSFLFYKRHVKALAPDIASHDGICTWPEFKDYYYKLHVALGTVTDDWCVDPSLESSPWF